MVYLQEKKPIKYLKNKITWYNPLESQNNASFKTRFSNYVAFNETFLLHGKCFFYPDKILKNEGEKKSIAVNNVHMLQRSHGMKPQLLGN